MSVIFDYVKATGSGNSFIIVYYEELYNKKGFVSCFWNYIVETHMKLDGLIILMPPIKGGDFKMEVFNPDGSATAMCLNGIRCAARVINERMGNNKEIHIETDSGIINVKKCGDNEYEVKHIDSICFMNFVNSYNHIEKIETLSTELTFSYVKVYTPYILAVVEKIDEKLLKEIGQKANTMRREFPIGINVSFVKKLNEDALYVRTYERGGIGLSLSCSSSMVAAVYMMVMQGVYPLNHEISVYNKGGIIKVSIIKHDDSVFANLIGDTVFEYKGKLFYESSLNTLQININEKFTEDIDNLARVKILKEECKENDFLIF